MVRWLDYLTQISTDLIRGGGVFKWNAYDARTPTDLIGTAWFGRTARTMAKVALALGARMTTRAYGGAVRLDPEGLG